VASLGEIGGLLRAALAQLRPDELARYAEQLRAETIPLLNQLAAESTRWEITEAAGLVATAPDELEQAAALYRRAIATIEAFMVERGMTGDVSVPEPPPTHTPPQAPAGPVDRAGRGIDPTLIAEAQRQGLKISPERVVRIGRDPSGRLVWLEKGSDKSGQQHIMDPDRVDQFGDLRIAAVDIVDFVFEAATRGTPVGITSSDRVVFELDFHGKTRRVAISVGSNGYIVGANPIKPNERLKPLL
jgi:hypothetical protein